jgi:chemotaxis protein CheX
MSGSMTLDPRDTAETAEKSGADLATLFIEAVTGSIGEMTHIEPVIRKVDRTEFDKTLGDVWALVGDLPRSPGCLALSLPMKTARGMAERVFAGVREPIDDGMVLDCIGELANILAGQVKSLLANSPYHFSISLPKVMLTHDLQVQDRLGRSCLRMTFDSEVGEFALQIVADI